jgi:hydrophobic/amphiphilic exporter-1 (mainly G- bacteria), HAE1 family
MSPLIRLSLRLGSVVILAVVLLFSAGIWAATQLQQDLLPNISVPAFVVITADPGASPGVVDQQVTLPIVAALQGVSGVTSVDSTSTSGASIVTVQFKDGTDLTVARQAVSTSLDRARAVLPAQVQPPNIVTFSTSSIPVLQYSAYANESLGDLSSQLRTVALPKLAGLSGVSTVNLTGAPTQEVDVTLDPAKLAAHGISVGQVSVALAQATTVQSVGALRDNGTVVPLQIAGALTSLDQIGNVLVSAAGVPIRDLGTVALVSVPADTITRTNGNPSVGLSVIKAPDANTVTVANEIKGALPEIRNAIGHGVQFQSILDQARPITDAIGNILREGLLGAVFAILVIFLFLRSARATLVAAVSIPLSLVVALLVLWWQGITLNILTLGGLMVAIGRVVDDAIVVLENISRHVSEGEGPLAAAYTGGREIVTAVTSSTLTTVAVFLPIAFLTGIAGSFFRPFALTVVTALLASLLVAVTVVPLLASRFLKPQLRPVGAKQPRSWLQAGYIPVIRWATGHRAITLVAAGAIFLGSLGLTPLLRINLLDQSSSPNFPVSLTMPDNSTLAQTNAETETAENLVRGLPGVSAFQATVGGSSDPFAPPGTVPAVPTTAQILVLVNTNAYNQALSAVKQALRNYHGPARVAVGQAQSSANASSSQMQVQVHAPNQDTLQQSTDQLMSALSKVSGLSELKSNLTASKPQYQLVPTDKLGQTGLSAQQLAGLVAQQINGQVAAQALLPSGPVSVRVQLPPGTADTPATLLSLRIPTAAGPVPLATLATLQQVIGPQTINRSNGDRASTITGTITGNNTSAVQTQVNSAIKGVSLATGTSVSTGGVFAQLSSVLTQFALAILAAIGLVYLIMVATFRSLIKPLVLLVSIPFAATGAIVALVVTGTALSLPAMIGLLMLTGIVVTNAIVLLDLVEQYRERGLPLQQALIEGGRHRLRPILMTAVATMLALAPLAFSGNSGGGFIGAPLAIVVIGGLFTSTLLTLILVPVLYSEASRFTSARTNRELDTILDDAQARRFAAGGGH